MPGLVRVLLLATGLLMTGAGDAEPAEADAPASPRWSNGMEGFVGVFGGTLQAKDSVVNGTYQCYFCTPVTVEGALHFNQGSTAGLRGGIWGGGAWRYAGLAVEASNSSTSGDHGEAEYQSFALTPLLRLPLFRTAAMPGGQVTPYVGVLLSRVQGGDMTVSLPGLPRPLSGQPIGLGSGVLAGVALKYRAVAVHFEFRELHLKLSMDSMAGDDAGFRVDGAQALTGLFYRF